MRNEVSSIVPVLDLKLVVCRVNQDRTDLCHVEYLSMNDMTITVRQPFLEEHVRVGTGNWCANYPSYCYRSSSQAECDLILDKIRKVSFSSDTIE